MSNQEEPNLILSSRLSTLENLQEYNQLQNIVSRLKDGERLHKDELTFGFLEEFQLFLFIDLDDKGYTENPVQAVEYYRERIKEMEEHFNKLVTLHDVMTLNEAAERYTLNLDTLKNKLKPSIVGEDIIHNWTKRGLARKSGATWLVTHEFIRLNFSNK